MRRLLWKVGLGVLALFAFAGCGLLGGAGGELVVELPRGGSTTQTVSVELPDPGTGELAADVMWLVDLSGSFDDDLDQWKAETNAIAEALRGVVPNFRVALSSFVDAPCGGFGAEGDYGYELELPFTSDVDAFHDRVNGLVVKSGSDGPESQLEAMYQAMTGEGREVTGDCVNASISPTDPGWGDERLRFLLVSSDASFHTPDDAGYPYPTSVDDVIATAERLGITLFFFDSGGGLDPSAETIADATGGAVFEVGSDSEGLVEAIQSAVGGAVTEAEVRLVPVGDEGLVSRINPSVATVDLTKTRAISFEVTFTDRGVSAGEVRFELEVRVNGSLIARIPVRVVLK